VEIVIDVGEIVADAVPMELCWKLGDGDGVKGGESTCGGGASGPEGRATSVL